MKNLRFVSGLFLGLISGVFLSFIITCKSEAPTPVQKMPNSITLVEGIDSYSADVYKLTIDNIQYIVVSNGRDGGIALIKHQ